MIVTDPDGENVYVVMDIDAYESLIDMEDQVFDSMMDTDVDEGDLEAPDLADLEEPPFPAEPSRVWDHMAPAGEERETWDIAKLNPEELEDLEKKFAEFSEKMKSAAKETEGKIAAGAVEDQGTKEEVSEGEDEYGEEQFYLEPIE